MGLSSLLRFANLYDVKKAIENPRKGFRVIRRELLDRQATRVPSPAEFDDERREALIQMFDTNKNSINSLVDEVRNGPVDDRVQECKNLVSKKPYSLGGMNLGGETAYLITRLLKPDRVLEIGVANGVSTAYILGALDKNESTSDVRSIDRPNFESDVRTKRGNRGIRGVGGVIPDGEEAGWVAPLGQRSRHGHQYYVGDFTAILPKVVDTMPAIDLAIYDASKDRADMKMAFEILIESLAPGGVIISDDIKVNNVFSEVAEHHNGESFEFGGIGLFRKEDS